MDYKPIIESRYNRQNWQNLLHDIFQNRIQFWASPFRVDINNDTAKCAYYLGKIQLTDGKALAIYEVSLSDSVIIERNKVSIRNLLVSHWKSNGFAGAFMFCFKQNESVLRFSYVSEILAFNADGKLGTEATDTKRFTYYLGEGHRSRTAIERFTKLKNSEQTLNDITKAFSVEALTKEFYNKLYNWYLWAVDDATGVTFPNKPSTADDDREGINVKIIRMITRLLFVWFVKQKNLVPEKLFDEQYLTSVLKDFDPKSRTVGNYYNAILQNLFFATLNRAIIDDEGNPRRFAMLKDKRDLRNLYRYAEMFSVSEDEVLKLFERVPFLNGGLFECLDKFANSDILQETDKYFDGFSRNDSKFANGSYKFRAFVPNVLFFNDDETHLGLINLLKQYNFTIEENSPNDVQVSLDPELLGRVFENLLASYNPETQESARNATGSFYTPREIVDYMVDESIVAHLKRKCPTIQETDIRSLFASGSVPESFSVDDCEQLSQAMLNMKILDPACGSGAFPMGCLLRLVNVIEVLQPEKFSRYDLKLKIIENCIYGVDIQPIAMMICKLRFFISLICEQNDIDFNAPEKNFGINTLPNLETKFVAANTLIGVKKRAEQLDLFENPDIDATKQQLITIRKQHFYAKNTYQKRKLRDDDKNLREKLAALLRENHNYAPEDAQQFAQWNPYDQNAVSPFFSPEWMFGIENGFDVVIGNPPYISTKGVTNQDKAKYEKEFGFSDDTYNLFTFKGLQLVKGGGTLTYITPKTFWTTQTKRNMRDLILGKQVLYIFDTANPFESAMVDTCITQILNVAFDKKNKVRFLDGCKNLKNPIVYEPIEQMTYINTQNSVIFKPTEQNMKIWHLYGEKVKDLYNKWWDKIKTSRDIEKNAVELKKYRESLKPGDVALLGCLTEGGQGLATANNGKYIAVRKSTKWAKNIIESRPRKLAEAISKNMAIAEEIGNVSPQAFLAGMTEKQIADCFDRLKEKYGRDIFGQGYIYKLIDDNEIADVDSLTDDEKENGIDISKNYYVPYDKGDKDGNRWYLETPFAIAWSKENVRFLKTNSGKKGAGMPVVRNPQFNFKEGFCWTDINSTFLKARLKPKGIFDVVSMSLFTQTHLPDWYFVCLINTDFMSFYVDNFINNTSHFQINDARQTPIIIPTERQLEEFSQIFTTAQNIKREQFAGKISQNQADIKLVTIQKKLDGLLSKLYMI